MRDDWGREAKITLAFATNSVATNLTKEAIAHSKLPKGLCTQLDGTQTQLAVGYRGEGTQSAFTYHVRLARNSQSVLEWQSPFLLRRTLGTPL